MAESTRGDAPRCALDGGNRPRLAAVGRVCEGHWTQLGQMLDPAQLGQVFSAPGERRTLPSIPVLYRLLPVERVVGERLTGGAFGSVPPGDLRAMALRDPRSRPDADGNGVWSPLAVLARIARSLDVRDIDGRPVPPPTGVDELAGWLHVRLPALCAAPWVPDAWQALRAVHGQLRSQWDTAARSFGTCRQTVDDAGRLDPDGRWRCAVPLFLPEPPLKGTDEALVLPPVRCRGCGWTYSPRDLVRIGQERQALEAAAS